MNAYIKLQERIHVLSSSDMDFEEKSKIIDEYILNLKRDDFLEVIKEIGIIPESVKHDSSEEKFYAKVSDSILAKGLREIGLKSEVLSTRSDSADVVAQSIYHNYSLVGDAKIFRMSRSAKNQKDFKVSGVNSWRKDHNYSVLCSPLYQYPSTKSQVYREARELNVSLFSWEYLIFLIENNIKESEKLSLEDLWNFSASNATTTKVSEVKKSFLSEQNEFISKEFKNANKSFEIILKEQLHYMDKRSNIEKKYWIDIEQNIKAYSKEKAIHELLKERNIDSKIQYIDGTLKGAHKKFEQQ